MNNYGDTRQLQTCVYCGKETYNRDHVPSKVLLDRPYPPDLPVVPSCKSCNNSLSMDEEYFACLIEIMRLAQADVEQLEREKIKRILRRKPALLNTITDSIIYKDSNLSIMPDWRRLKKVIAKHAKGLSAYEMNSPVRFKPDSILAIPWTMLSEDQIRIFNQPIEILKMPEVGCRLSQRVLIINGKPHTGWVTVQENRFRYQVSCYPNIYIKFVFFEYLMCEVFWRE